MEKLKKFIDSDRVQNTVLAVIFINAVLLGFMTSDSIMAQFGSLINMIGNLCLAIFVIELVIKLIVYGSSFFKDGWNLFDFFVVAIAFVPAGGVFTSFRMLRVLRVFRSMRALRMVSRLRKLKIIVQAIVESVPNIGWTSLLLLIIYYIFAIIGTTLFGHAFPEWFGNLGRTAYTLFQIMTLESWSMGISRPVMEVFPWAYAYFIPFILLTAFIVLNVVIGVVVNTIGELSAADKAEHEHERMLAEGSTLASELEKLKAQIAVVEGMLAEQKTVEKV